MALTAAADVDDYARAIVNPRNFPRASRAWPEGLPALPDPRSRGCRLVATAAFLTHWTCCAPPTTAPSSAGACSAIRHEADHTAPNSSWTGSVNRPASSCLPRTDILTPPGGTRRIRVNSTLNATGYRAGGNAAATPTRALANGCTSRSTQIATHFPAAGRDVIFTYTT